MFFNDVDLSILDEDNSFNEVINSIKLYQESKDHFNKIKFLLEDELVNDTNKQTQQQGSAMVTKILEWIRTQMQSIIDFAQNLYSNNRFEAIKLHIKNNVPDGATLQVPEVLTTIPSQVSDLERYLGDINKGVYEKAYNFTLPDKTKLRNVNKAGLIQIVDDLQRAKTVFPKVTATFNRARTAVTQDNEKANQVMSAMKETIDKIRSIFKESAIMINNAISNIQASKTANEVSNETGATDKSKTTKTNDAKKSENVIFDMVFDYMVLDENKNILVSESKEEFNLLNNIHGVYTICEGTVINEKQKDSFINLKNNKNCLNEEFCYNEDVKIKYILFKENGNIVVMCEDNGEKIIVKLDSDLNIL